MPLNLFTPLAKLPGSFEPLGPAAVSISNTPNPAASVTPVAGAGNSGGAQLGTFSRKGSGAGTSGTEGTPVDAPATLPEFSTSPAASAPTRTSSGTPVDAPATVPDFSAVERGNASEGGVWSETFLDSIARPAEDSTAHTPAEAAADSRRAQQAA